MRLTNNLLNSSHSVAGLLPSTYRLLVSLESNTNAIKSVSRFNSLFDSCSKSVLILLMAHSVPCIGPNADRLVVYFD